MTRHLFRCTVILALAAAIPPLVYGYGLAARGAASVLAGIRILLKSGIGGLAAALGPGAVALVGVSLLAYWLREAGRRAIESAQRLGEFKAALEELNEVQLTQRSLELEVDFAQATQGLRAARQELAALKEQERGLSGSAPIGLLIQISEAEKKWGVTRGKRRRHSRTSSM